MSDWRDDAACAQAEIELFFPAERDKGSAPKSICASCTVREQCLEWALEHHEYGIWGGTTEDERSEIRRNRRRRKREGSTDRSTAMSESHARRRKEALDLLAKCKDVERVARFARVSTRTVYRWAREAA